VKEHPVIRKRFFVQLMALALFNGYAAGFAKRHIFTGKTKALCVPVLNCYSCPGALGSCPIGSLQAVTGGIRTRFPFYVLGTLMLFGVVLGRVVCGFLCPFGLVQDLLNKIPHGKNLKVPAKPDHVLRFIKYFILLFMVLLLPAVFGGDGRIADPFFCKYICPSGTLGGGIPNVLLNEKLRPLIGPIFTWKMAVLIVVLAAAVFIPRFFCRYLCPLGAFYGLFNRFALYQMNVDDSACIHCGKCEQVCPMTVEVTHNINSAECIRCGRCVTHCPKDAISAGFSAGKDSSAAISEKCNSASRDRI